jgi:hypothetical protein
MKPVEVPSALEQSAKQQQQLPSFAVWQARQLWSRDLLFGCVLALILILYYSKTVPKLCLEGSLSCPLQQQQGKQQQLLWRIICGDLPPDPVMNPSFNAGSCSFGQCSAADNDAQLPGIEMGHSSSLSAMQQAARLAAAAAGKIARPLVLAAQVILCLHYEVSMHRSRY